MANFPEDQLEETRAALAPPLDASAALNNAANPSKTEERLRQLSEANTTVDR